MTIKKNVKLGTKKVRINCERYDSADTVVADCRTRQITDSRFRDIANSCISEYKEGVSSYGEALELMRTGYQPTVDALKGAVKVTSGAGKRISFQNNIAGFAPVVPLALIGVPNCMIDTRMKPIKAKVLDVYYDITVSWDTRVATILENGRKILSAIVELEHQGYRFNLYAVQSYYEKDAADMLVVKVKSASQPLDIKRVSVPLTHPAFFRVIGFDWYSKTPDGVYRDGYGSAMGYHFSRDDISAMAKQMWGDNAMYFSASTIARNSQEYVTSVLSGKKV